MRLTRLCPALRSSVPAAIATGTLALLFFVGGPAQTENAIANGDTRTIHLYHTHTHESIAATYMVDGRYDPAVLHELNHFLRDWRNNDEIGMDPKLFDVIWETYRESGSTQPIQVVSAYRSPVTNAMLRRRSKAVAAHSQHMLGKAMDMHYADVPMSKIREIALRLQRGGVGYYPTAGIPFVHLDVGSIRYWPRMSYQALSQLFPDGKAVFLAADGRPLPHYQEARAELALRTDQPAETVAPAPQPTKNFFAMLFGGGDAQHDAAPPAQTDQTASIQPAAPLERKGEVRVASSDGFGGPGSQAQTGADQAASSKIPLPPQRPIELVSLKQDPAEVPSSTAPLAAGASASVPAGASVAPLLRAANVPSVITRGVNMPPAAPGGVALAYAPSVSDPPPTQTIQAMRTPASPRPPAIAPAVGLRAAVLQTPVKFVAARLDPSNFTALVSPTSIARTRGDSELGSVVGGLRSAAGFSLAELVFGPPSSVVGHFGSVASDLRTRNFTGLAVRPLGLLYSEIRSARLRGNMDSRLD